MRVLCESGARKKVVKPLFRHRERVRLEDGRGIATPRTGMLEGARDDQRD
jgi:hypothetical protein